MESEWRWMAFEHSRFLLNLRLAARLVTPIDNRSTHIAMPVMELDQILLRYRLLPDGEPFDVIFIRNEPNPGFPYEFEVFPD